jgi:hypothetical protein
MHFTDQQLKLIHQAVRYYQIHGIRFNGSEYKVCDEILNITFDKYYPQDQEQKLNGN